MNKTRIITTTNGTTFEQLEGQLILDASIEASSPINHSCRSGRCGFCKVKVLSGESFAYRQEELTPEELADNWILTCARSAKSDLHIDAGNLTKISLPKRVTIPCGIAQLTLLSNDVLNVTLRLPLISRLDYLAGQYVDITSPNGICRSYSLAKAKVDEQTIEIHIRRLEQGAMSNYWFNQAKVNDLLTLQGPKGTFFLRDDIAQKDLYFLATGTGIAPINALLETIESLPKNLQPHSITVIWGEKTIERFYMDLAKRFSKKTVDIKIIYTLTKPQSTQTLLTQTSPTHVQSTQTSVEQLYCSEHHGYTDSYAQGYVQKVLLSLKPDLTNSRVYACGSSLMINDAQALLIEKGLDEKHFLADAFVISRATKL
ncbi:FAD-binding oxidoreductase [Pseudocolwellia sp. AS88]|uniref:FAD-binding oxidoreductase n=1 Tax=Pseudocolwellia sp. AS88 TaxID=3063958 RepID=UPI0026EBD67A|nr:FAD-binding oxidoreductase [Pseudocolwellia sp. AS88]MDO7085351.1 FAD-binding oxidoreductase [Pseudocolwellia sp. AS88]